MRISRKTQNTIKNVVSAVLAIAILLGVASLIGGLTRADDEGLVEIHPVFSVGGVNELGKYIDDNGSIYTEEAFECRGLKIRLDFEETIDYEVFFYDGGGKFISSSGMKEETSVIEVPTFATHARIEITPDWEALGEDYEDKEDQIVKWYDVSKYAKQMTIKVDKEQEFEYKENVLSVDNEMMGAYWNTDAGKLVKREYSGYTSSKFVDVSKSNYVTLFVPAAVNDELHMFVFTDKDKETVIQAKTLASLIPSNLGDYYAYEIEVPDDAVYFVTPMVEEYMAEYMLFLK